MNHEKIICHVDDVGVILTKEDMSKLHIQLDDCIEIMKSNNGKTVGFRQYSPLKDMVEKNFVPVLLARLPNIYTKTGQNTALALLSESEILWQNQNWDTNRRIREDPELMECYAANKITGSHVYSITRLGETGNLIFTTALPIMVKNQYMGAIAVIFESAGNKIELYKYTECLKIIQATIKTFVEML